MKKKFGKCIQDFWSHKNPGTYKYLIIRPTVDNEKKSVEDQQEYWSGLGMLPYPVKYLHPDLANVARELSKANNGMNPAACVIKYVLVTRALDSKLSPW